MSDRMVTIRDLGDARDLSVTVQEDGYIAVQFLILESEGAEPTFVQVGLHPRRAGHLLELLAEMQRSQGFPLPSGSIVTETPQ